ncbi:hypothetical protein, partial [Bacillus thuringiensis]|uniref:hypothetical protein n=1 Tax=Bacillus thuringiensis TaxID=1428 RepID=UPI0020C05160
VELSAVNRSVAGSNPACGANASIDQQVEHFNGKEEVSGSSPLCPIFKTLEDSRVFLLPFLRAPFLRGDGLSVCTVFDDWPFLFSQSVHQLRSYMQMLFN